MCDIQSSFWNWTIVKILKIFAKKKRISIRETICTIKNISLGILRCKNHLFFLNRIGPDWQSVKWEFFQLCAFLIKFDKAYGSKTNKHMDDDQEVYREEAQGVL